MLTIRPEQVENIDAAQTRAFRDELRRHVQATYPEYARVARRSPGANPSDYPCSSHAGAIRGPDSPLLKSHPQLLSLGPDPASHRVACHARFDEILDAEAFGAIREATNGNYVRRSEWLRQQIRRDGRTVRYPREARPAAQGEGALDGPGEFVVRMRFI